MLLVKMLLYKFSNPAEKKEGTIKTAPLIYIPADHYFFLRCDSPAGVLPAGASHVI